MKKPKLWEQILGSHIQRFRTAAAMRGCKETGFDTVIEAGNLAWGSDLKGYYSLDYDAVKNHKKEKNNATASEPTGHHTGEASCLSQPSRKKKPSKKQTSC